MRIQYDLKFRDYLLFNGFHQLLSPTVQGFYLLGAAFILLTEPESNQFAARLIAAILLYVVMWSVQLLFNVVFLYSSRNRTILTQHTITILDEALLDETMFNKSEHYWLGIFKVVKRPGFVAVYLHAHAAHIIPNRAFLNAAQSSQFVSAIKQKLIKP